jgi:hypothetical protein
LLFGVVNGRVVVSVSSSKQGVMTKKVSFKNIVTGEAGDLFGIDKY